MIDILELKLTYCAKENDEKNHCSLNEIERGKIRNLMKHRDRSINWYVRWSSIENAHLFTQKQRIFDSHSRFMENVSSSGFLNFSNAFMYSLVWLCFGCFACACTICVMLEWDDVETTTIYGLTHMFHSIICHAVYNLHRYHCHSLLLSVGASQRNVLRAHCRFCGRVILEYQWAKKVCDKAWIALLCLACCRNGWMRLQMKYFSVCFTVIFGDER